MFLFLILTTVEPDQLHRIFDDGDKAASA